MNTPSEIQDVRSGMVAIVGPPNAGKSTLLNCLLGQKISIVSPKPQTTRNRILGVVNTKEYQIVLIDTPGLHRTEQRLNKEMVRIAVESLSDVDAILFLVDVKDFARNTTSQIIPSMEFLGTTSVPTFLLLNKTDLIVKTELLPIMQQYADVSAFTSILPVSAKTGQGMEALLQEIVATLPVGPRYFPEDIPTDASERFLVGEIIREKVFLLTGQEIPYSTAVVIDAFQEKSTTLTLHASIVVEKDSQKGIVIGKGGRKLKSIGIAARKDIERMVGEKVLLKLFVKVKKNWSQNSTFLKEMGL
ncbi:MAG: GTPase Era [Desulfopila sp.]